MGQLIPSYDDSFKSSADGFEFLPPTPSDAFGSATMSTGSDTFMDSPFLFSHPSTQALDTLGLDGTFMSDQRHLGQNSFDELTTLFSESRPETSTHQRTSQPQAAKFAPDDQGQSAFAAVYQLSAFSASLCASVDSYSRNDEKAMYAASMEELGKLAAEVLQSSLTFLRILRTFVDAISADESDVPDTPTTLQIVTAYIRLTQLHLGLYMQIKSLLLSSSNTAPAASGSHPIYEPIPPAIFQGLTLNGLSMASFARFQLKFIVQVCVHELGIIEATLGLPAVCRISDVGSMSESERPILGAGNGKMGLLVWSVLTEVEQPVHGIRHTLIELRESLRGSIQI
jgi:hypothetical protein